MQPGPVLSTGRRGRRLGQVIAARGLEENKRQRQKEDIALQPFHLGKFQWQLQVAVCACITHISQSSITPTRSPALSSAFVFLLITVAWDKHGFGPWSSLEIGGGDNLM